MNWKMSALPAFALLFACGTDESWLSMTVEPETLSVDQGIRLMAKTEMGGPGKRLDSIKFAVRSPETYGTAELAKGYAPFLLPEYIALSKGLNGEWNSEATFLDAREVEDGVIGNANQFSPTADLSLQFRCPDNAFCINLEREGDARFDFQTIWKAKDSAPFISDLVLTLTLSWKEIDSGELISIESLPLRIPASKRN